MPSSVLIKIKKDLKRLGNKEKAGFLEKYFRTNKCLGVKVPDQRKIAHQNIDLGFNDLEHLLRSDIHEHRFTGLEILVAKYERADVKLQKKIVNFYLKNKKYINNWDLVDTSAPYILGHYLSDKNKDILYKLARSKNLWEKRIAIVATYYLIKQNQFNDTIKIAEILYNDREDLVQKAVGWMLREVGNKSLETEEKFLKKYYTKMPRTMLRYATEKFPTHKRKMYMTAAK